MTEGFVGAIAADGEMRLLRQRGEQGDGVAALLDQTATSELMVDANIFDPRARAHSLNLTAEALRCLAPASATRRGMKG